MNSYLRFLPVTDVLFDSISGVCLYSLRLIPLDEHSLCSHMLRMHWIAGLQWLAPVYWSPHILLTPKSLNRILNCNCNCDASAFVKEEGVLDFLDPPDPTHLKETLRMTVLRLPEGVSFIQHPLGETERFELNRTKD